MANVTTECRAWQHQFPSLGSGILEILECLHISFDSSLSWFFKPRSGS